MPAVDVVIPNFNGAPLLTACLEAMRSQTLAPAVVIVVDDASTDESCALLSDLFPEVAVVRRAHNGGFAAAVNTGITRSRAPLVALLNNDTVAEPGWLEHAVLHLADDAVAAVACLMVQSGTGDVDAAGMEFSLKDGPRPRRRGERPPVPNHVGCEPCFAPCAGAAVYRRSVFNSCGLFDEDFYGYNEDVDLGFKMQRNRLETVACNASRVEHRGGQSFGHGSYRQVFLSIRNELALFAVHVPTRQWWRTWPSLALHHLRAGLHYSLKKGHARAWCAAWADFLRHRRMWRTKRRAAAQSTLVDDEFLLSRFSP